MSDQTPSTVPRAKTGPSPASIASGLSAGSIVGTVLSSLNLMTVGLMGGRLGEGLFMLIFSLPVTSFFWISGLLLIGAPSWALLHWIGLTRRWAGAVLGGTITPLCIQPLIGPGNILDPNHRMGWPDPATNLATFGAIGAIVGWVVVRVAYGKDAPR
ncbi:MAG: hypothetical protein QM608_11395 [Caulobacter sp.]